MEKTQIEIQTVPCLVCKKTSKVLVDYDGLKKYQEGALIQDAFPELSADVREMLMTGTHPECWKIMWPEDE